MFADFVNFKIKVLPKEFISKSGRHYPQTASVSFFGNNKKVNRIVELAYIEPEEVYLRIDRGEEVNLDNCYVPNFSLSDYRKSRQLAEETLVILNDFSAEETFFDSKIVSDFSYAHFEGNLVSFDGARFICGEVSFHKSVFSEGLKNFTNMLIKNGAVDFSNAQMGGGIIDFKNSIFCNGLKNFQYTEFGNGKVSFINAEFGVGDVNFINANFGASSVSFKIARFNAGKIDFQFAHFGKGDISFERTDFGDGKVDFRKVEFGEGKLNFNRAAFGAGEVTFEASELNNSRMTFKKTDFGNGNLFFEEMEFSTSELLFDNIQFKKGSVYFGKSHFKKLSLTSCHINHYFDFRVASCNYLDLSDTIVRDIVDFSSYDHKVIIGSLNISGMRLIGQIYIDWYENNVQEIISNQTDTTNSEKAEQFRILKENYGRTGNYNFEDLAYIQFKRNEQKADLQKALSKSKMNAIIQYPLYFFKLIVFDRMGLYATSPSRVITSLILIYFSFSTIHFICPYFMNTGISCLPTDAGFFERLLNTFYYSIITFTTVGYGDCSPYGFLRFVASFEGFVGPFMMSYFTVAFARKILR